MRKISGPLLDRIDIQIEVKKPKYEKICSKVDVETSLEIKKRVNKAKEIQLKRYKEYGIYSNSELTPKMVEKFCKIEQNGEELLKNAFKKFKLSVRAYERILKVSRTIADLDGKESIETKHIAEAIQYRCLDKFVN